MKTILQIAKEIGIDKQRIYRCIKKHGITSQRKNGVMYFGDVAERQIKQYFSIGHTSSEVHHEASPKMSDNTIISVPKSEVDFKNELIKEQQQTIKELTAILKVEREKARPKPQKRKFKKALPEIKNMGIKRLMKYAK